VTLDQGIGLFSAIISFTGLLLVVMQLRDTAKTQVSQSLVEIYDINRQLISLGFSHPHLFDVLAGKPTDRVLERRYLQLWFNHFSLVDSYIRQSVLKGDLKESLVRDLTDFMHLKNARHHWDTYAAFYPESFQTLIGDILKENEPPIGKAAHPDSATAHRHHDAST
jgi:hypothetical protein